MAVESDVTQYLTGVATGIIGVATGIALAKVLKWVFQYFNMWRKVIAPELPVCYGVVRSPQSDAENDCMYCGYDLSCQADCKRTKPWLR